jgi:hypothetical protein
MLNLPMVGAIRFAPCSEKAPEGWSSLQTKAGSDDLEGTLLLGAVEGQMRAPGEQTTIGGEVLIEPWRTYVVFKNQGDCVSFVATGGKNEPGKNQ